MQKKRPIFTAIAASTEIYLLIISLFAFGFMLHESTMASAEPTLPVTQGAGTLIPNANVPPLASSSTLGPTQGSGWIFGDGSSVSTVTSTVSPTSATSAVKPYTYKDPLGLTTASGPWAHLYEGLIWAAVVVGAIQLFGPMFGADKDLTSTLSISAAAGIFAYKGIAALGPSGTGFFAKGDLLYANAGAVGIIAAVVVFALLYKKESSKVVELQCLPWEAPLGGSDCEKCNGDPLHPCSEYRCKSLGQACELVNKGTSEERCTWVARNDVKSPVITPWTNVLTTGHRYTDTRGRPPSLGTSIVRTDASDGCIRPFTALQFGLRTDEPSQCKIDTLGNKTFEEMQYYVGESNLYRYNHTQEFRLPSPGSINDESPEIPNEGNYNFYIRCRDANGNTNEDEFVVNLCVDKSPDTTAPVIEETSILSGSPVTFGVQNLSFTAYVNEPAECKWGLQDKDYNLMETNMSCSTHVYEQNARQLYPCTTTLTGIKDRADNTFYMRCKDQPLKPESERNTNSQSFKMLLKGTQSLTIISVGPNSTFTGSTSSVPVDITAQTRNGAEEGKATCYFSPTGAEGSYVAMFETGNVVHSQKLTLAEGNYTFSIRCVDNGGNADVKNTSFTVMTDRTSPQVTRIYKEEPDALKVITNENAECVYSLNSCNFVFEEGLPMKLLSSTVKNVHLAEWKPNLAYFIKCRDAYDNQPSPNACSIVASGTSIR